VRFGLVINVIQWDTYTSVTSTSEYKGTQADGWCPVMHIEFYS